MSLNELITPSKPLDVKLNSVQLIQGATNGFVLTSNSVGQASWQANVAGATGFQGSTGFQGATGLLGPAGSTGPAITPTVISSVLLSNTFPINTANNVVWVNGTEVDYTFNTIVSSGTTSWFANNSGIDYTLQAGTYQFEYDAVVNCINTTGGAGLVKARLDLYDTIATAVANSGIGYNYNCAAGTEGLISLRLCSTQVLGAPSTLANRIFCSVAGGLSANFGLPLNHAGNGEVYMTCRITRLNIP